jgi:hypothetical protein
MKTIKRNGIKTKRSSRQHEPLVIPPPVLDRKTVQEFCTKARKRLQESRAFAIRHRDEHSWFYVSKAKYDSTNFPLPMDDNIEVRAAKLWNERVIAFDDAISAITKLGIDLESAAV